MANCIHLSVARKILQAGQPCSLKVWKISNAEIIHYNNAICISNFTRGASHKIKLLDSGQIRQIFDYCIFEINDMEVFL